MRSFESVRITKGDIAQAAKTLGVDEAAIHAVIDVESAGSGFWQVDGYADIVPLINYEQQWFRRLTNGAYDNSHPHLSARSLDRQFGKNEWGRFTEAGSLDREAAIKATSWGLFQIMGFNYRKCNYDDVEEFIEDMKTNEGKQLQAFVEFIRSKPILHDAMKNHEWAIFAYHYNGPKYRINEYDARLEAAYRRHAK